MVFSALILWPQSAQAGKNGPLLRSNGALPYISKFKPQSHSVLPLDNEALCVWELSMVLSVVRENVASRDRITGKTEETQKQL